MSLCGHFYSNIKASLLQGEPLVNQELYLRLVNQVYQFYLQQQQQHSLVQDYISFKHSQHSNNSIPYWFNFIKYKVRFVFDIKR